MGLGLTVFCGITFKNSHYDLWRNGYEKQGLDHLGNHGGGLLGVGGVGDVFMTLHLANQREPINATRHRLEVDLLARGNGSLFYLYRQGTWI